MFWPSLAITKPTVVTYSIINNLKRLWGHFSSLVTFAVQGVGLKSCHKQSKVATWELEQQICTSQPVDCIWCLSKNWFPNTDQEGGGGGGGIDKWRISIKGGNDASTKTGLRGKYKNKDSVNNKPELSIWELIISGILSSLFADPNIFILSTLAVTLTK